MFSIDQLLKDKELRTLLSWLIPSDFKKLGCFVSTRSIEDLYEKLTKANYEFIKYLPISGLSIYKTFDLGYGYCDYFSLTRFKELMERRNINKNLEINLSYEHGNIFTTIYSSKIDVDLLLTDEVYILVKEETKEIWNIKIGKPTNPNRLYFRNDLDNISGTIERVATIQGINCVKIEEIRTVDYI